MSLIGKIVGYWGLNGNSNDSHGSNDGSDNSITYNTPGVLGSDYTSFAGSPSRIDLAGGSPITGTGSWSVFVWVRTTASGYYMDILGFGKQQTNRAVFLFANPSGNFCCDLYAAAGVTGSIAINDGNWHLCGAVYDSGTGTVEVFVDNVSGGTGSISPDIGPDYCWFGQVYSGGTNLTGDIDDVSIYNDVLIPAEINDLWNSGAGLEYTSFSTVYPNLVATAGSFSLTGNSVGTTKSLKIAASQASFTFTGQSSTITDNGYPNLVADQASFTYAFRAFTVTTGITNLFIAPAVNFNLTGISANITKQLGVTYGAFTLTGNAVTLTKAGIADLLADAGNFSYAFRAFTVTRGVTNLLIAPCTNFIITGNNAQITRVLSVTHGSYSLTGNATNFSRGYSTLVGGSGDVTSFIINGQAVNFIRTRIFGVGVTNFLLSRGITANLIRGFYVSTTAGNYYLTGQDANLLKGSSITCTNGSFALTGNNNNLLYGRILPVTFGSYSLTGQSVNFLRSYIFTTLTNGSFTLTGITNTMYKTILMAAGQGSFVLTFKDGQLVYASALGPGLILANLEGALAKLMDQNNPDWPGFPPGNAVVVLNFATAVDAYAKFVRPQSSGATLGKVAMMAAMLPLMSAPVSAAFFPAFQAGLTAYATALGVGMASSGNVAVPPILPINWVAFLALPKDGPLIDKIEDLSLVIHSWFLTGTATPILGGTTVDWS